MSLFRTRFILRFTIALGGVICWLILAAGAHAATYCVQKPSCVGTVTDLQTALTNAAASSEDDTIEIGPVTITGPFRYAPGANAGELRIIGSGASQTALTGVGTSSPPAVLNLGADLSNHREHVSQLAVQVPKGASYYTWGIFSSRADIDSVSITPSGGAGLQIGAQLLGGSTLTNSNIAFDLGAGSSYNPVESTGAGNTIDHLTASGMWGVIMDNGASHLTRSTISARVEAVEVCNTSAEVDNLVLRVVGAGIGLSAQAENRCAPADTSVTAKHLTVIGDGAGTSTGVKLDANPNNATVDLRHSIIRGIAHAVTKNGTGTAKLTVGSSDFDLASAMGTAPGDIVQAPGNINADPLFVNPVGGDYHLQPQSPAIDAGPSEPFDGTEATTDLDGNPRILDGNGDGIAARDMGAFESPTRAPTITPQPDKTPASLTGYGLSNHTFAAASKGGSVATLNAVGTRKKRKPKVGTTVRFTLSETATVTFTVERPAAGRRVKGKCVKPTKSNRRKRRCTRYVLLKGSFTRAGRQGKNRFKFTGRLRGRKLAPGSYRLIATAVDTAQNVSPAKRVAFRIVAG